MTRFKTIDGLPKNIALQIANKIFDEQKENRDALKLLKDDKRKTKYNNVTQEIDGYKFDSKKESERYNELKLLEIAGEITELKIHPRFILQDAFQKNGKVYRAIEYIADFTYIDSTGQIIVEDVKGFDIKTGKYVLTKEFKLKQKLFEKKYPLMTIKLT